MSKSNEINVTRGAFLCQDGLFLSCLGVKGAAVQLCSGGLPGYSLYFT